MERHGAEGAGGVGRAGISEEMVNIVFDGRCLGKGVCCFCLARRLWRQYFAVGTPESALCSCMIFYHFGKILLLLCFDYAILIIGEKGKCMDIEYKNSSLRKDCTDYRKAVKKFNAPVADKLLAAVNFIEAAQDISDVVKYPPFHFHPLERDRKGFFLLIWDAGWVSV